ncbi:glycosyltransferase [Kocuria sp.]|uniref:glycosyltransferase n=1 Tax=Kocuria sp. TaxID=1871328 RepID=UPI0026E062A0|nr:glycosyltransferase [Kocuria sp.]MDO5619085.1 glycosyltransferase [Kocuria sp.]
MSTQPHTRVIVVCPTEYGGQIEHAADTAMALAADSTVEQVILLSRPGAAAYLGQPRVDGLRIVETIPPRRTGEWGPLRRMVQVLDLIREHAQIRALSASAGPNLVLALDSSKYPWPRLLTAEKSQRLALFLHNVKPHHDETAASLRERVLRHLELGAARGADRVIVHGADQKRTARQTVPGDLVAVTLPTSTRIDEVATAASVPVEVNDDAVATTAGSSSQPQADLNSLTAQPYALVLGELRANKGVELAIDAAGSAGVPLLVAGRPESAELGRELHHRADRAGTVTILDRFLERTEFAQLLDSASVVVLPYTRFDAQSGILAKAVAGGLPIVASDLASLKEQAGAHQPAIFADVHNTREFGQAMRRGFDAAVTDQRHRPLGDRGVSTGDPEAAPSSNGADHSDWDSTVAAVLGTRRAGRRR